MPLPSASRTDSSADYDQRPRLLIVDDEEGPRQSLKIVFKSDYQVYVASNGPDALDLARKHSIDVAVLDILMQGMSGVELLGELKAIDPLIEVVMLTAYETIETTRHALRFGACDYLDKPFDILTMRAAVAKATHKRRTALEIRHCQVELHALQHEIQIERLQQEIDRTKGEIYASVLHDINSPLMVIACFIDLLNRSMQNVTKVDGKQLQTIRGDLHQLKTQVAHCFEISRRYLSFLHADSERAASVAISQILIDLKCLLLRHPSGQGQELIIAEGGPDLAAEFNGTDLLQILLNLTINALQCSGAPHRVEVQWRRLDDALDLAQFVDGPQARFLNREGLLNRAPLLAIAVSDNGPGIPPEVVGRLFDQQISTKKSGTGLGLSIVKRLLAGGKGALHLETSVTCGSTFTVILPAATRVQRDHPELPLLSESAPRAAKPAASPPPSDAA